METLPIEMLRTPELQRLRKIRQLGMCNYVFPGAEHSRLSHSLGACHLAIRFAHQVQGEAQRVFARHLVPDEHAIVDLALAALCHDLGHGPLSHAWEREIVGEDFDRKAWAEALGLDPEDEVSKNGKWHEVVGHGLLEWPEGQLHRLLELHERDTVARLRGLLAGRYYYPYLPRLLSGDIDVDRADFIMRDTHNTGVAYGRFDLSWLLSTCTLGRSTDNDAWVVGFDKRKAVRVIEQFLIARRALYETVYHHKTVRCIEGMVALLLRRLKVIVMDGRSLSSMPMLLEPTLKVMRGQALPQEELIKLDDFSVFVLIDIVAEGGFRDDTAQDLARRLQARDLFKQVSVPSERIQDFLGSANAAEKLHEAVKPFVPGHGRDYVLLDQTRFSMMSRNAKHQAMLVDAQGRATKAIDHQSFSAYRDPEEKREWRLFTVAPAIEALTRVVLGPSA